MKKNVSQDLLYTLTKKSNAFLAPNLHGTFTHDPYSCSGVPKRKDAGFILDNATALSKSENDPTKVRVVRKLKRRSGAKRDKGKSTKSGLFKTTRFLEFEKEARRVTVQRCGMLSKKGGRLHRAANVAARAK